MNSSLFKALTLFVFLSSSCTYRHWVKPDEVDVRESETVFRAVAQDGDTVSFAGSSFIEGERNHLTGVSGNEFVGQGGIRSEGTVTGVDSSGKTISLPEEDVSALEIPDRTAMVGTVSLMLVSIPATIIVLGAVFSNRYHGSVL